MHWKVVFKDLETGNLLYNDSEGEIRTDFNGLYEYPIGDRSHRWYMKLVFLCVDSSGIDTLSMEQSTIGENFSGNWTKWRCNVPV